MKPKRYSSRGLVISRKNYGEADRILIVFSSDYGKVRLLAKGIRKLRSRKRGHLEVFSHIKFSASVSGGIDLMTEVETLDTFTSLRQDLRKVSVAYYFVEVLDKLTREGEKQEVTFELLLNFIERIDEETQLKRLRKDYVHDLLVNLGYWPLGKKMNDPDQILEEVIERRLNSVRVGKKLLT